MGGDVRVLRANGIRIAYRTWGTEGLDGVPVVLLHCLGRDGADWHGPLTERLAACHPRYAPDLRGHGRSDWPGEYGLESLREDVRCFLDALALERAVLIGHSLGSAVAGVFAGGHPGRVLRLVLEETPAMLPLDPPREIPDPELRRKRPEFDFEMRRQWNRQRNEPDPRWWRRLSRITAPALVVGGGPGSHLPQRDMARVAERIPHGRFVTVAAGGHLVHERRPREFAAAVGAFLAADGPGPGGGGTDGTTARRS